MLAYAHINLLSMLSRFTPDEVVQVATDSIYVRKSALHKGCVAPKRCDCGEVTCVLCSLEKHYYPLVAPGQWRDKGEQLFMPMEHAAYLPKSDYIKNKKDLTPSTAPHHDDPLSRHCLSYLNGGGGSGKTTRAVELFRRSNLLVLTPTHCLASPLGRLPVEPPRLDQRPAADPVGQQLTSDHQ